MKKTALVLLVAAVAVPAAFAAQPNSEPKHEFTKADQAKAKRASLKLSDFAAGWHAEANASNSNADPKCKDYNPDQSDLIETGKYDSPDFTRGDGSFVSVSTGVFKTTAMAKTAYTRVAAPALPRCFGELLGKQAKTTVVSAGPLSFPSAGDRSNAYRLVVSIKTAKAAVKATIDFVLFTKGRTDVATIFFGLGGPLPASVEQAAVARVLSRA